MTSIFFREELYIKTMKVHKYKIIYSIYVGLNSFVCICELVALLCTSPLAPLAPVFRSEMQAFGINAEVAFLHGTLVAFHYVLGQGEDILTLEVKRAKSIMLKCPHSISELAKNIALNI